MVSDGDIYATKGGILTIYDPIDGRVQGEMPMHEFDIDELNFTIRRNEICASV
jgi:hypothetical protein